MSSYTPKYSSTGKAFGNKGTGKLSDKAGKSKSQRTTIASRFQEQTKAVANAHRFFIIHGTNANTIQVWGGNKLWLGHAAGNGAQLPRHARVTAIAMLGPRGGQKLSGDLSQANFFPYGNVGNTDIEVGSVDLAGQNDLPGITHAVAAGLDGAYSTGGGPGFANGGGFCRIACGHEPTIDGQSSNAVVEATLVKRLAGGNILIEMMINRAKVLDLFNSNVPNLSGIAPKNYLGTGGSGDAFWEAPLLCEVEVIFDDGEIRTVDIILPGGDQPQGQGSTMQPGGGDIYSGLPSGVLGLTTPPSTPMNKGLFPSFGFNLANGNNADAAGIVGDDTGLSSQLSAENMFGTWDRRWHNKWPMEANSILSYSSTSKATQNPGGIGKWMLGRFGFYEGQSMFVNDGFRMKSRQGASGSMLVVFASKNGEGGGYTTNRGAVDWPQMAVWSNYADVNNGHLCPRHSVNDQGNTAKTYDGATAFDLLSITQNQGWATSFMLSVFPGTLIPTTWDTKDSSFSLVDYYDQIKAAEGDFVSTDVLEFSGFLVNICPQNMLHPAMFIQDYFSSALHLGNANLHGQRDGDDSPVICTSDYRTFLGANNTTTNPGVNPNAQPIRDNARLTAFWWARSGEWYAGSEEDTWFNTGGDSQDLVGPTAIPIRQNLFHYLNTYISNYDLEVTVNNDGEQNGGDGIVEFNKEATMCNYGNQAQKADAHQWNEFATHLGIGSGYQFTNWHIYIEDPRHDELILGTDYLESDRGILDPYATNYASSKKINFVLDTDTQPDYSPHTSGDFSGMNRLPWNTNLFLGWDGNYQLKADTRPGGTYDSNNEIGAAIYEFGFKNTTTGATSNAAEDILHKQYTLNNSNPYPVEGSNKGILSQNGGSITLGGNTTTDLDFKLGSNFSTGAAPAEMVLARVQYLQSDNALVHNLDLGEDPGLDAAFTKTSVFGLTFTIGTGTNVDWDFTTVINGSTASTPAATGCTDATAINYDSSATVDDSTCFFCGDSSDEPDSDNIWAVSQSTTYFAQFAEVVTQNADVVGLNCYAVTTDNTVSDQTHFSFTHQPSGSVSEEAFWKRWNQFGITVTGGVYQPSDDVQLGRLYYEGSQGENDHSEVGSLTQVGADVPNVGTDRSWSFGLSPGDRALIAGNQYLFKLTLTINANCKIHVYTKFFVEYCQCTDEQANNFFPYPAILDLTTCANVLSSRAKTNRNNAVDLDQIREALCSYALYDTSCDNRFTVTAQPPVVSESSTAGICKVEYTWTVSPYILGYENDTPIYLPMHTASSDYYATGAPIGGFSFDVADFCDAIVNAGGTIINSPTQHWGVNVGDGVGLNLNSGGPPAIYNNYRNLSTSSYIANSNLEDEFGTDMTGQSFNYHISVLWNGDPITVQNEIRVKYVTYSGDLPPQVPQGFVADCWVESVGTGSFPPAAQCDPCSFLPTCLLPGCTDDTALNYDADAGIPDGSCIYCPDEQTEVTEITLAQESTTTLTCDGDNLPTVDSSSGSLVSTVTIPNGTTQRLGFVLMNTNSPTISYIESIWNQMQPALVTAFSNASLEAYITTDFGGVFIKEFTGTGLPQDVNNFQETFLGGLPAGGYTIAVTTDIVDTDLWDNCKDQFTRPPFIASATISATETSCQIPGCTDPNADNYNESATVDDGSCTYPDPPIQGCTDTEAVNYNSDAEVDDGSCLYDSDDGVIIGNEFVFDCVPTTVQNNQPFEAFMNFASGCVSEEGNVLMAKIKTGVQCSREDNIKISLITYLLNRVGLPCIYNCNDDYPKAFGALVNCVDNWKRGSRNGKKLVFTPANNYQVGDVVAVSALDHGTISTEYYVAVKDYIAGSPPPRYKNSGWKKCLNTTTNSGDENYLETFISFMSDKCTICSVPPTQANRQYSEPKAGEGRTIDGFDLNGQQFIID